MSSRVLEQKRGPLPFDSLGNMEEILTGDCRVLLHNVHMLTHCAVGLPMNGAIVTPFSAATALAALQKPASILDCALFKLCLASENSAGIIQYPSGQQQFFVGTQDRFTYGTY